MITRNQIISEAKSWLHTPFHPQARIKSVGCDCIGLIIGVAQKLKIGDLSYYYHKIITTSKIKPTFLSALRAI
ncbi:MAG: hypothetical protein MRQ09_06330 [Candidatus Midichloria sp.]|nr:hypothetical protein [Candidatus Midichloria sp.]